ncbi:hypothetical protein [Streptomyces sp. NPDC058695]|uniref:hypothetical protein n=1 Tax=Streptomyces sp. NPDC058695 TaxID=3346604 RepID=UPI00365A2296
MSTDIQWGRTLSVAHRDNSADSCPTDALATDMARGSGDRVARRVYSEGVGDFADWPATEDQGGMARICTMVGALVLARATREFPISEDPHRRARSADGNRSTGAPGSSAHVDMGPAGGVGFGFA